MVIVIALLVAGLALLYLGRRRMLRAAGDFLIAEGSRTDPFDVIVLMNGNISTRPFLAAELYRQNPVPVLIARLADTEEVRMGVIPNVSEATRELLVRLKVAPEHARLLDTERWVAGTWGEAVLLCAEIRDGGFSRVLIVTDAFHTRRARWTFRKVMGDPGVDFRCVATKYSIEHSTRWWRSEYGLVHVVVEYLKFMHYRRLPYSAKHRPPLRETDFPKAEDVRKWVSGQSDR